MSLIVGLAVVATAGGAYLLTRPAPTASTTVTRTAQATKADVLETVSVSGSVSTTSQRKLNFSSNGTLSALYVSVGQSVISGQKLARIDTTDLETALATAQQNLANAQASYEKQLLSASDTQKALASARTSAANDVATAQATLSKLKANYAAAKTNFETITTSTDVGIASFQNSLSTIQSQIDAIIAEMRLLVGGYDTGDLRNALNAITSANSPALQNARANSSTLLSPALSDFDSARSAVLSGVASYDAALAAGSDTSSMPSSFQLTQSNYTIASSRLTSALDTTSAVLGTVQTAVTTAQASLNTQQTRDLHNPFDQWRADLATLYNLVSGQQQSVSTVKLKLSQSTTYLATLSDAVGGSIANAAQSVVTTQQRGQQSIDNAQSAVANIPFNLQAAQSSVDNANDAVATAQSNLDAATLTSPTDGVVTAINAQVGETVTSGASGFIVITSVSSLVVHGTVGEADVTKLKLGQAATITLETSGTKLTGKVTAVDPVATISSGVPTYGVDIKIDRVTEGVKPGMTASASVITAKSDGVITVPSQAVKTQSNRTYVVVVKDGVQTQVTVKTGLSNDSVTEITSGLAEGDTVVVSSGKPSAGASQAPGLGGAPNGAPSGGAGGPPGFGGGQ